MARSQVDRVQRVAAGRDGADRTPGQLEGRIAISPDFDETLADVIDPFEGS